MIPERSKRIKSPNIHKRKVNTTINLLGGVHAIKFTPLISFYLFFTKNSYIIV